MSIWRVAAVFWVPLSVLITALAVAGLIDHVRAMPVTWIAPFTQAFSVYSDTTHDLFAPVGALIREKAGFGVPAWMSDLLVAYAATASGFAFAGSSFAARGGRLTVFRSMAASVGWPLAILAFAGNAVGRRVVTRFAAQHTILFVLYIAAVTLVLAVAVWGPGIVTSVFNRTA